ncbi:MAG: hypothetical protein ACJ8EH_08325 [Sphingomicrobium sp.]
MQLVRPPFASHPSRFGRGPVRAMAVTAPNPALSDDVKLFAGTFIAGFLFVSILIG